MTHEEMIEFLTGGMRIGSWYEFTEIAHRLDRYRNALLNARNDILVLNQHCASNGINYGVDYISEALK